MAGLKPEFEKRNRKIFGLSVDPVEDHRRWAKDIEEASRYAVTYPMIGDPKLNVHLALEVALHAGYVEIASLRELIQGF